MTDDVYSFGPFRLDRDALQLLRDGKLLKLRRKCVDVLIVLIEHAGSVVSYDELGLWVWKRDYVEAGTVIVTVHEARAALEEYGTCIKNFQRLGYRFEYPDRSSQIGTIRVREPGKIAVVITTFADSTRDQDKAPLASGVTTELATELSRIGSLTVIKATPQTVHLLPPQHTEAVKYLVEGSLAGTEKRLQVTVQLLGLPDHAIIWGNTYPARVDELQGVQSRIAVRIAEKIKGKIHSEEANKMQSEEKVDGEAHKLYLLGLHHWSRPTETDLFRALEYFRQATSLHPSYAKAFASMAHTYALLGLGSFLRPDIAMPQAQAAALKCLELFPDSPEGLAGVAAVEAYYLWNWKRAEELLKRAIALKPDYDTGHHLYAMGCLMPQARLKEALREIRTAWELNPLSPFTTTCVGIVEFYARNYDRSIEQFDRALELQPHYHLAHWHRAWALVELRRFDEAIGAVEGAVEMSQGSPQVLAALGQVYAAAGQAGDSQRILRRLRQIAGERYVSPYDLALIHISLSHDVKAMMLLREAVAQRVPALARIRVHPLFDRFKSNPQFVSLLRMVNLIDKPNVEKENRPKRRRPSVAKPAKRSGNVPS